MVSETNFCLERGNNTDLTGEINLSAECLAERKLKKNLWLLARKEGKCRQWEQ